jgi:hypothetical protein
VLLEASENVWDDLIDEMSDRDILDACKPWISTNRFTWFSTCRET